MDPRKRKAEKEKRRLERRQAEGRGGAAARAPRHSVDAYLNTSHAQIRSGRNAEAAKLLGAAVREYPREPRLLDNLVHALDRCGRHEDAVRAARKRVELGGAGGDPHHTLSALLKFQGRLDEARQACRQALALDPFHSEAWGNLTTLERFTDPEHPDLSGMRTAHAHHPEGSAGRMHLDFALGKALEDLGDVDASFAHYAAGNRVKRAAIRFDLGSFRRLVRTAIETQDEAFLAQGPASGASPEAPILVVGMPRSGSTLVEQILASHPDCEGTGELGLLGRALGEVGRDAYERVRAVPGLTPEQLAHLGRVYVRRLGEHAPRARRVVDKYLQNYLYLGFLARAVPGARFVHVRRDPMDNGFACFKVHFHSPLEFVYDLGELGGFQVLLRELMEHWERLLPERLVSVDYEALVADQEGETRRLLEFLGLPWNERCLHFERTERHVTSASSAQVRQPVYASSVGRWKPYAAHLEPLREALGDLAP